MKTRLLLRLIFLGFAASLVCPAADTRRDIEYGSVSGEPLLLDVCVPDGPGPFPTVILVHGGAWTRGDKGGGDQYGKPGKGYMVPMQEPLTRAGFVWFSINYRLAPKHTYPACIEDVETAIRWVKLHAADFHVDPDRIALSGESAGGQLVALAAVRADDLTRVAAVVPFYGPYNLDRNLAPQARLGSTMIALFGREIFDATAASAIHNASPIYFVKPGLPPFLLVHGTADDRVPIAQSENFAARLKAAGVPCELLRVNGGGHGMVNWERLDPHYKDQIIAWLTKTLAPTKAPAPSDGPAQADNP